MNQQVRNLVILIVVVLAIVGGVYYFLWIQQGDPTKFDQFAQCLKDKGVLFYGAFWCPHCQNQKSMFGASEKYLPYIECSTPDGKGELQECIDQKIETYPTWKFPDGSMHPGEMTLQELADKSGCQLTK